ncbi:MAG: ATP-binding protein [Thermoanaerobacteraceae bacterium]|nr:ATP-binding protein [Thermoanaerobacteraceae bacterium]
MDKNIEDLMYVSQFYNNIGYVIYNPDNKCVYLSYNTYGLLDLCPIERDSKNRVIELLLSDADLLKDNFYFKYKVYNDKKFIITRVTLNNSSGGVYLFIFISPDFIDLSLEKMQEFEELNIVGTHARTAAHEIKNSLTVIKGFLQLLKSRYTEDIDFFNLMLDEVERANDLVVGLMHMNMLSESDLDATVVNDVLKDLIKKMSIVLRGKHIIKTHFEDMPQARITTKALEQVCLNLIQNAIEAMDKSGIVYIYTDRLRNGMIRIRIADNGCGIPDEIKDKIFLSNFTTKKDGTGYGLAITLAMLKKYDSQIRMTSRIGKGSIFTILLPVAQEGITG